MNDTHSPGVSGIGFVIFPRFSYKFISSKFLATRIGKLGFDISRLRILILSTYARQQSMHIRMKQCLFTTDSLQLSMQSQHAITFSYVVTSTQHCLSIKFVSKTDVVMLMVTLRCSNAFLSAMTCLLPMCTQGKDSAHFRPLMDQMGVRHGLIGFSAYFVIDLTSRNPIHLRHL